MNSILKYAALTAGGVSLFAGTYVGVAAISGTPLHKVAGLSLVVEAPQANDTKVAETEPQVERPTPRETSGKELLEANAGMLGAFMLESPFSSTELRKLENQLKSKLRDMGLERERQQLRSLELDEREQSLRERQAELADQRTMLEELENSIDLRMAELMRDEAVHAEKELEGWKEMAKIYEGGTPEANASLLAEELPKDAALILRELDSAQAGEILRVMQPASIRKEYMDAYRAALAESKP